MSKLRIGIIGVGGIAQGRHIPAFQTLHDECVISAVSDVNEERAKEVVAKYNIEKVYEDYHDMFQRSRCGMYLYTKQVSC